jgi:hypothetical protein
MRRFWLCHYEALQEVGANEIARHFENLTYLVGDSVDFVDFNGPLQPSCLHATAIFYAQYDPRKPGSDALDPVRLREALYHDIAETALTVLKDASARRAPEGFRAALAAYHATEHEPTYFNGPERRGGGGPVVVRASQTEAKFHFEFPPEMK